MASAVMDQTAPASIGDLSGPIVDELFSPSDDLTCLEIWNFEVGQAHLAPSHVRGLS